MATDQLMKISFWKQPAGVCLALAWAVTSGSLHGAESPRQPLSPAFLTQLVVEAEGRHPGLRAADARTRAAGSAVQGVRVWEDPMVKVGGVVSSDSGPDLEMEGDLVYEVEQSLPLFGKARAMRREAEAEEGVSGASRDYQFQLMRRSIVQSALRLALAEREVEVGEEDYALLERMVSFVRERQKAGLDATLDLLRLESEQERRQQALVSKRLERDFERSSLNVLLGRPEDSTWPVFELPAVVAAIPWTPALAEMGVRNEPRLRMMRRETDRATAGIEVTRRSRFPEVTAGIEGRQWSGTGEFREGMFTVGLTLPWANRRRYRADLDRDTARADAVRAEAADYEREVRRELFRVWSKLESARREAELYRDRLVPRAELAVTTAMTGWTTGRTMFLEVMDARRMLSEARVMLARAVHEQHQMVTELVTCCGVADLDSLTMLGVEVKPASP